MYEKKNLKIENVMKYLLMNEIEVACFTLLLEKIGFIYKNMDIISYYNNCNKLRKLIINLPNIFSIPIILIAYNYLLYQCIGISFVPGVVVMIIFLLINYYYRTQFSKYLKLHMKKSDSRINVTTEMINNLKSIKLNAWDDLAIKKIQEARGEELNALDMRYYITTISQTLLWFAPIAMSIASIGLYQYLNVSKSKVSLLGSLINKL